MPGKRRKISRSHPVIQIATASVKDGETAPFALTDDGVIFEYEQVEESGDVYGRWRQLSLITDETIIEDEEAD